MRARAPLGPTSRRLAAIPATLLLILALGAAGDPRAERPVHAVEPPDTGVQAASPFLLTRTDVAAVVSGPVSRVEVTQTWLNPNEEPVDGLYIFPLPEDAAVHDMRLVIGDREIRGEMKRREEARALYDKARAQGRVAGLLDQERPNIFAQRVANIMPGREIRVVLAYDRPLACEDGGCEFDFPTVVGPRFIPADQADPGAIDPPVVAEGAETGQSLGLTLRIDAGVTLSGIASPSHRLSIIQDEPTRAEVRLVEDPGPALDRDVIVRWRAGGDAPETGLLAWHEEEARPDNHSSMGVFTLLLQPPVEPADDDAAPRELVFVLDCSGSMSGVPMEAAKGVVRRALAAVRPGDTFQILRFSESASGLAPAPLSPTPANLERALAYLDSLHGQGGTQMIEGIRAALDRPADPERLRIVAFLTDGYIGNERQILAEVQRLLGDARLFSFGIGSSVNRFLLEGLAEEGRGAAAFLGARESPEAMVERFVKRIDTPVLTDIRLAFEDLRVRDLEPARIPDLFAGQALLIHGRYRGAQTGVIVVEATRRGRRETWRQVAVLPGHDDTHAALGRLWARARIHRLERELHAGPQPDVVEAITLLGLRHRLLTAHTSLVAVDSVISNRDGSGPELAVPVEMPEDVSYQGVFGYGRDARLAAGAAGRLRSLGYVSGAMPARPLVATPPPGGISGKIATGQAHAAPAEVDPASGSVPEPVPGRTPVMEFLRLVVVTAAGDRLEVDASKALWSGAGGDRSLVRTLTADQVAEIGRLLAAANLPARILAGDEDGCRCHGNLAVTTEAGSFGFRTTGRSGLEKVARHLIELAR